MKSSRKNRKELQQKEKERIRDIFNQFDTDHSDSIDKNEFLAGMKSYFNLTDMSYENEFDHIFVTIFNLADKASLFKKKDSKLDLKEFTKIIKSIPSEFNSESFSTMSSRSIIGETLFNMIDDNGNGSISKSEFKKLCTYLNIDKKQSNSVFKEIDGDKSNSVGLQEFLNWFESF